MHSLISPHKAWVWGPTDGCRAYPHVTAQYPEKKTESKKKGIAAHKLAVDMIRAHTNGSQFPLPAAIINKPSERYGIVIDRNIYDAAQIYASHVVKIWKGSNNKPLHIEEPMHCPDIHPESNGVPDCWLFDHMALHIWEFKNGHVPVPAFEHLPAVNYASGIINHLQLNGKYDQHLQIYIHVVQPNAYKANAPIDTWHTTGGEIRALINILHISAHSVMEGNVRKRSGAHCRVCEDRFGCEVSLKAAMQLYEASGALGDVTAGCSGVELATNYTIMKELKNRTKNLFDAMEEEVQARLLKGESLPGLHPKRKRGNAKWIDNEIAAMTADAYKVNIRTSSVLTPRQAIIDGVPEDIVNALSKREAKGFKVEKINARSIFYGSN